MPGRMAMYTSGWPKNQNRCCQRSGEPPLWLRIWSLIIRPAGQEETGAGGAVQNQQHAGGQQHGETQQPEDGGDQPGPAGQRHAHQRHALAAQVHGGGDEVDGAHQRCAAEDRDADDPEGLAHAFTGTGEPARRRSAADTRSSPTAARRPARRTPPPSRPVPGTWSRTTSCSAPGNAMSSAPI